jgi:hypothetical protein
MLRFAAVALATALFVAVAAPFLNVAAQIVG